MSRHADCIDGIIRELVDAARVHTPVPLAVCAVGGYGRKSQFLCSDIDLLMVFGGPIGRPEERFVKALLHPLWDLRFQVGHHVREIADFDRLDTTNPEYLLSLMDLRPLAGDRDLIDRLEAVMKSSAPAWRPQILDALVALTDQRHSEFDDTLYQLEPDVKDGPGALRDVWATRMMLRLGGDRRRVAREVSPDRIERRRRISHAHPLGTACRHGAQHQRAELRAAGKGRRSTPLHRSRTCAGASKR